MLIFILINDKSLLQKKVLSLIKKQLSGHFMGLPEPNCAISGRNLFFYIFGLFSSSWHWTCLFLNVTIYQIHSEIAQARVRAELEWVCILYFQRAVRRTARYAPTSFEQETHVAWQKQKRGPTTETPLSISYSGLITRQRLKPFHLGSSA